MAIHTRKGLEADLTEIRRLLPRLGKLAGEALMRAVSALEDTDRDAAKDVIAGDDLLDGLAERIEDTCMKFGARYQPLGEDHRAMISGMHMAVDLERAGDHLTNIAERVVYTCSGRMPKASGYKAPRGSDV